MKVLVLLSGGLDSMVALGMCLARGDDVRAITFDYGQTCRQEVLCARRVCAQWVIPQQTVDLMDLPGDTHKEVPARNLVFLAHAASHALCTGADRLVIGSTRNDVHPDSSTQFLSLFTDVVYRTWKLGLEAPVKHMGKVEIVEAALELGVPLALCHSSWSNRVDGECKPSEALLSAIEHWKHDPRWSRWGPKQAGVRRPTL